MFWIVLVSCVVTVAVASPGCQPAFVDFRKGVMCEVDTEQDLQDIPQDISDLDLKLTSGHDVLLRSGVIPRLSQLRSLKLDVTYVGPQLPAGLFQQLPQLKTLSLYHVLPPTAHFQLSLPPDAFAGLHDLASLHLVDLGLRSLTPGVFRGLDNLQVLDVNKNSLSVIPNGVFEGLRALNGLSLARNRIDDLSQVSFKELVSLASLNLYSNHITDLAADSFDGLSSLSQLNLEQNQMVSMEQDAFRGLSSLNKLYLENNNLTGIKNGTFAGLHHLQTLRLSGNRLTDVAFVSDMLALQHLHLDDNAIEDLDASVFDHLRQLRTISLVGNQLRHFPRQLLSDKAYLQELDISKNALRALDSDLLEGLSSLQYLFLSDNDLSTLPSVQGLMHLEEMDVSGNPLQCDCDLFPLALWLKSRPSVMLFNANRMLCAGQEQSFSAVFTNNTLGCVIPTTAQSTTEATTTEATPTQAMTTDDATTTSNASMYSGQHDEPPAVPPVGLGSGATAGIIAGLVLVTLMLVVFVVLGIHTRQKRHAFWTPSKDPLHEDVEKRVGLFYRSKQRAPLSATPSRQNSVSDARHSSAEESPLPNGHVAMQLDMDAEQSVHEPQSIKELDRCEIRDSGLGNSMAEISMQATSPAQRPHSYHESKLDEDLVESGSAEELPPRPSRSVRSMNSYEGAVFNDTAQHFPSSLDLVYM